MDYRPRCTYCEILLDDTNWYPSSKRTQHKICKICDKARKKNKLEGSQVRSKRNRGFIRSQWCGPALTGKYRFEIGREAEQLAYETILPKEGFSDIVWLDNHHAPFDLLATKDGKYFSIDVTASYFKDWHDKSKGNNEALAWLINHDRIHHIILFVSRDLTRYLMKEASLTCRSVRVNARDLPFARRLE